MRPVRVALRHFLMQDAAARGHPLHVARAQRAAIAEAVAMLDGAGEHIGDGLDAAMRMPRKAGAVILRPVVAEIVEQQERVEVAGVAEPERAAQLDAGAFHGGRGLDDALHGTNGHGGPLNSRKPLIWGSRAASSTLPPPFPPMPRREGRSVKAQ